MTRRTNNITHLLDFHRKRKKAIRARLRDFERVPSSEYFYELAYCLLTPQTSAGNAEKAVRHLRQGGFQNAGIDPEPTLASKEHYIRFHKTKAKHLLMMKQNFPWVLDSIANASSSVELREWLVTHVKGLGYKEATHFLRNIGRNDGLAILDRHILRNLKRFGAIRTIPASLSRRRYFSVERRFMAFAERIGIPLDELDLLFWSMETGEIRK
jgi:N-glycosylase/DNA lyase